MHPDELAYGRDLILRLVCKRPSDEADRHAMWRRVFESPSISEDQQMMVEGLVQMPWLTLRKD